MRIRTLVGGIAVFPVLVALAASPADARQDEGEPYGPFCALAGLDLLAALDGSWTIHQGEGAAQAGVMSMPLPAPPPASVTFAFDAPRRLIDLPDVDQADGLIMFPVAPMQLEQAAELAGEAPTPTAMAPVCAWLESPTVIGTNQYVAWSEEHWIFLQNGPSNTCEWIEESMGKPAPVYDDPATAEIAAKNKINNDAFYKENCAGKPKPLSDGGTFEMELTLVLRFTSPSSGAGMVYFEGKTDQSRFRASAPVTITR